MAERFFSLTQNPEMSPLEDQSIATTMNPIRSSKEEKGGRQSWVEKLLFGKQFGLWVLLLLLCFLLYLFVGREIRFFMVPSSSMEPTLLIGDMIVTLNQSEYSRGDIIVLKTQEEYLVKRLIGLPGDTLTVIDGALFINGKYASEPYIREGMNYYIDEAVLIPPGKLFYLGDNRNYSDDSSQGFAHSVSDLDQETRLSYLADMEDIVGKVKYIYYPYNRLGPLSSYKLTNVAGQ
jgi:signal peptidase I